MQFNSQTHVEDKVTHFWGDSGFTPCMVVPKNEIDRNAQQGIVGRQKLTVWFWCIGYCKLYPVGLFMDQHYMKWKTMQHTTSQCTVYINKRWEIFNFSGNHNHTPRGFQGRTATQQLQRTLEINLPNACEYTMRLLAARLHHLVDALGVWFQYVPMNKSLTINIWDNVFPYPLPCLRSQFWGLKFWSGYFPENKHWCIWR